MDLMKNTFPPPPEQRVTLANWRTPPFNRWAFNHVRELVPSAGIATCFPGQSPAFAPRDLRDFALEHNGERLDLDGWLRGTYTDSLVILKNGQIAFEYYAEGQSPSMPHIWMSVSKSILGLIAGIVAGRGLLDPAAQITDLIPELKDSAFAGATVRDALDMRVGIRFDEDYHAKEGAIIAYRKSHLWDPLQVGESPSDMRSFFSTLTERDGDHHGRFHYVSPNTDLLGWVLERATGTRFADLVSQLLWQPIQAERDAYITVDRFGAPPLRRRLVRRTARHGQSGPAFRDAWSPRRCANRTGVMDRRYRAVRWHCSMEGRGFQRPVRQCGHPLSKQMVCPA